MLKCLERKERKELHINMLAVAVLDSGAIRNIFFLSNFSMLSKFSAEPTLQRRDSFYLNISISD